MSTIRSSCAGELFALSIAALGSWPLADLEGRHKGPLGEGIALDRLEIRDRQVVPTARAAASYGADCFAEDRARIVALGRPL